MNFAQKGLMIAAPHSGSGKTVVSLALLRALKMRNIDIRAAKAGPDYIDPRFHAVSCGTPSVNLDPWAMSLERCRQLACAQGGSHLLVESMMGLYDGAADGSGSGASLANALGISVLLVVDAAKQSHSVAALVRGFRDHNDEANIAGVILNKVGSARHEAMLRAALDEIDMPVMGVIFRSEKLILLERHLGLVQADELDQLESFISNGADMVLSGCDMGAIEQCFAPITPTTNAAKMIPPPGQNIGVANDKAFSFIYPHLINDWRAQGAQVNEFSPLANEAPSIDTDAIYLPGGYPELYGSAISSAGVFIEGMKDAHQRGALIYGECGGYMVLGEGLIDANGQRHAMLGMLDLETSFEKRKLHLGYRKTQAVGEFFAGTKINAHEFHYSLVLRERGQPLFTACDVLGEQRKNHGLRADNVMGSYLHLIDVESG